MIHFEQPLYFALLVLLPLLIFAAFKRKSGLLYPSMKALPSVKSLRIRFRFLRDLFIYLALAVLITAAAGPYRLLGKEKDYSKGHMLQLLVDRSGSMGTYMDKKGQSNRLDIVKRVLHDFIKGNGGALKGRGSDRLGLVSFALYADTMAPLTVSHDVVLAMVDSLGIANEDEDGTSLGDALALGLARIVSYRQKAGLSREDGGALILLTDGRNNSGNHEPLEAAKLAKEQGIRIYTIGFGGGYYQDSFGFIRKIPPEYGADEKMLKAIAQISGGSYFAADDEKSLTAVYRKIDEMEKVEMEQSLTMNKELYFPDLLLAAFGLLTLAALIRSLLINIVEDES